MMILYEQGKWEPSDTISKYVPEFAHLKVYSGVDADGKPILVDPIHAPTMRVPGNIDATQRDRTEPRHGLEDMQLSQSDVHVLL